MAIAEKLYNNGLISYPRTETTKYPANVKISERISIMKRNVGNFIEEMDWESSNTISYNNSGIDVGDHQPILPTTKGFNYELDGEQRKIYELICRHFIASFNLPYRYHTKTVTFNFGNGLLINRQIRIIDEQGFTKILPWEKVGSTNFNNNLLNQKTIPIIEKIKIKEEKSTIPNNLTEFELIELMEKNRIGTDGSIPGHIDNILKRNYVEIDDETRCLKPTNLGLTLYNVYKQCIPELLNSKLRANVEKQLNQIAKGQKEYDDVRTQILEKFKQQFKIFKEKFPQYTQSFKGKLKFLI